MTALLTFEANYNNLFSKMQSKDSDSAVLGLDKHLSKALASQKKKLPTRNIRKWSDQLSKVNMNLFNS